MIRNEPAVSVISPTHEHARFIDGCIESVLGQSYESWEQIVIDDASTDGTSARVRRYADPRVRLIEQEHRGVWRLAETYNAALAAARGNLIAILEGDDHWPPEKLASLVPIFDDPEVVLAYGVTEVVSSDGAPLGPVIPSQRFRRRFGTAALTNIPRGEAAKAMLHVKGETFTFPCSVVIRRTALEAIGGFRHIEGLPFVDYPTFLHLSLRGSFAFVDRVMGYWRRHEGSQTWTHRAATERLLPEYVRGFLAEHASDLGLSREESRRLAGSWSGWSDFHEGRRLLLERRWSEGRIAFLQALRSGTPRMRIAGTAGYTAALLHLDLEAWIRRAGVVDVRVVGAIDIGDTGRSTT